MGLRKNLTSIVLAGAMALGPAGKADAAVLYDDFSSGTLDSSKWEVRQDPEN